MKNITTALLCLLFSVYSFGQCDYTLKMMDSYGDGWNGNTIDVLVDGVVILGDATIADGFEELETFQVNTGAEVTTVWNGGGTFASEISYEILDNDGNTAATGNSAANVESGQCIAVCPVISCSYSLNLLDSYGDGWNGSDNISMGESTFMVEMNETASILNNISERSLVLLDEIGRGTSTYDGISIAWAISEYLHEHPSRAKTLFATHYHELNEMTETFSRIKNYNVAVKELKNNVLFLRTLVAGGSQHSFGIHVAKMAGMPQPVLQRSKKILKQLEKSHSSDALMDKVKGLNSEMQLSFFNLDDPLLEELKADILDTDIDRLTPIEALMKLNEIKRKLSKKK